ncbi:MAG: arginine deiminase-related protein [Bdellovibrionota bacterium]
MTRHPKHILMTTPTGFRIAYAINPHMLDEQGKLKVVDGTKAREQWQALHDLYLKLGFQVSVVEGREQFPDIVFAANPTFPFLDREGRACVVMARMHSKFREGEIEIYRDWAQAQGLRIHGLSGGAFEGCGDAIWNFETGEIFGGHGFRTEKAIYSELERITGAKIHLLHLTDPRFYHLDTCLVILNAKSAAYVPEAFSPAALETLETSFENLLRISIDEAVDGFAGNAFCPDGKNVVLQAGNTDLTKALRDHGFVVHEVETGEFIKSGGSVFCMKQQFWR